MSDKAYYIAQIVLMMTIVMVVVSAAGFDLLQQVTPQAWIGTIMMVIALATLKNAAKIFREVRR